MDLVSRVLFPRPPPSYTADSFPGELVWVPRSLNPQTSSPEDCIPLCLLQCEQAHYLVVYLHSNFEDIGRCHGFCEVLRSRLQVHVLIVEYPGYGVAPGRQCDEQGAIESAHVALRFANEVLRWPWENIILFGRSIGTGPATTLAPQHRFGGLVLACPFLSVRDMCRDYIGPAAGMVREKFPNKEHITMVRSPVLFVHGQKDSMIPVRHGRELYEACVSRKRFVSPAAMEHNSDLLDDEATLLGPLWDFFRLSEGQPAKMQVPSWAFDKQLSPVPGLGSLPPGMVSGQRRPVCSLLGMGCSGGCAAGCSQCGGCRGVTEQAGGSNVLLVEPVKAPLRTSQIWTQPDVEETVSGAVEQAFEPPEESSSAAAWADEEVALDAPLWQPQKARQARAAEGPSADAIHNESMASLAEELALNLRMQHILRRAEEVATQADHRVSEGAAMMSSSFNSVGFVQV